MTSESHRLIGEDANHAAKCSVMGREMSCGDNSKPLPGFFRILHKAPKHTAWAGINCAILTQRILL
jgi:hypothetical protein